ncbi:MAG: ABC transporter substrate-binding protein [Candidatus Dormiibacterota bacterium]
MIPEEARKMVRLLASGRLSRRQFIERAAIVGLSSSAAMGLLQACGANQSGGGKAKLVVGVDTDIDDLDPMDFKSDAAYEAVIQTYETLVSNVLKPGSSGAMEATSALQGAVAEHYSVSPDSTTYTFKVRPNVTFSNGHPVDAKAFEYSLRRALLGPGYASLVMGMLTVKDPSQLRAVDDSTFTITLEHPNPMASQLLPLTVLDVMDPTVSQQHATGDDQWANAYYKTSILGTGPYVKGATWQSGSQYLFSPNPSYWDKSKVKNAGVLMKYIPSSDDRLLLIQRGDLDVAFGLPAKNLDKLRSGSNVKLWNFPSRNTNYVVMNEHVKPFDDVRVRQAIAYAVPYDTLIKNALYGFAQPLKSVVAAGMPTANASGWPYATDAGKAKSLLTEAGFGNGFRSTLSVSLSRAEDADVAVWIQSALAKIGIQLDINKLSDADYRAKQAADQLPMFIDYWYSWANDPFYQLFWLCQSQNKSTNLSHYANPQMDSLIAQGIYNTNDSQRADLSKQAQAIFARDVPLILLYQRNFVLASRSNVSGVGVYPDQYLRFWELSKS